MTAKNWVNGRKIDGSSESTPSVQQLKVLGGVCLNKAELVNAVAEKADLTKRDAERVINAVFDSIEGALAQGEKVQLVGFGTFEVRQRAARTGRNPKTGEEIDIPATKVPIFKAGKSLREAVMG